MPAAVAVVFILEGALIIGMVMLFTGAALAAIARRRNTPARAPLIAMSVGFIVALAAAITVGTDAALHLTTQAFTHSG